MNPLRQPPVEVPGPPAGTLLAAVADRPADNAPAGRTAFVDRTMFVAGRTLLILRDTRTGEQFHSPPDAWA